MSTRSEFHVVVIVVIITDTAIIVDTAGIQVAAAAAALPAIFSVAALLGVLTMACRGKSGGTGVRTMS